MSLCDVLVKSSPGMTTALKKRIKTVSDQFQEKVGSFSSSWVQNFLKQRKCIVEQLATHVKYTRAVVENARAKNTVDRRTAKRLFLGTENVNADILKKRAALAKNRVKLEYAILCPPAQAHIGKAYMNAIIERLSDPDQQ